MMLWQFTRGLRLTLDCTLLACRHWWGAGRWVAVIWSGSRPGSRNEGFVLFCWTSQVLENIDIGLVVTPVNCTSIWHLLRIQFEWSMSNVTFEDLALLKQMIEGTIWRNWIVSCAVFCSVHWALKMFNLVVFDKIDSIFNTMNLTSVMFIGESDDIFIMFNVMWEDFPDVLWSLGLSRYKTFLTFLSVRSPPSDWPGSPRVKLINCAGCDRFY